METIKDRLDKRINKLAGNQARITLLALAGKANLNQQTAMFRALEIAESYDPESELKSF